MSHASYNAGRRNHMMCRSVWGTYYCILFTARDIKLLMVSPMPPCSSSIQVTRTRPPQDFIKAMTFFKKVLLLWYVGIHYPSKEHDVARLFLQNKNPTFWIEVTINCQYRVYDDSGGWITCYSLVACSLFLLICIQADLNRMVRSTGQGDRGSHLEDFSQRSRMYMELNSTL
jgi:hypothetical protein